MKKFLILLLLLPVVVFGQSGTLTVGERQIGYGSTTEVVAGTLYYQRETLVASEHDAVTIVYENDVPIMEAHDTDGDGTLDTYITLDANEEVVEITGAGADVLTRQEIVELEQLLSGEGSADEDLVGSLDSITIPRYRNYTLYAFLLLLIGGGWWYYRRKKK